MNTFDSVEDDDATGLLPAGRFSALSLLSPKALRIYAERGLLVPHHVDPNNGYRYYHPDQVSVGWLIALLRGADMPLEQVGSIVGQEPTRALAALDAYAASLDARAAAHRAVLARARHHLRKDSSMTEVTSTLIPDRPVLSLLRRLHVADIGDVIHASLAELRIRATDAGLREVDDPFGVFHSPVTEESDGPLEICLVVDDLTPTPDNVRSYRLPGGRMATRTISGAQAEFPELLAYYDEVASWVDESGGVRVGPPREVWPAKPSPDAPLSLTICWPYAV